MCGPIDLLIIRVDRSNLDPPELITDSSDHPDDINHVGSLIAISVLSEPDLNNGADSAAEQQ